MSGKLRILKQVLSTTFQFLVKNKKKLPKVINLNANDICNSGCVMCNIWEQKKEYEISGIELEKILRDPLYRDVTHVGITGGEPTLRKDLIRLYEAVIAALPNLVGVSIITNGIKYEQVKKRITEINELCVSKNINFSVMVSLDGVGSVHDLIRGTPGNFKSTEKLLDYLQYETSIPISIGCTISKQNIMYVDDVLHYIKSRGVYGKFRIAEFIKRLYNERNTTQIRNFSKLEVYYAQLFFNKLIHSYEKNESVIRTYKSILNMLNGGKRLTGCPYQEEGIVLNSKGELAYCAPKSEIIGNANTRSSIKIYKENLEHRKKIRKTDCDNCIHDYHAKSTFTEYKIHLKNKIWVHILNKYGTGRAELISSLMIKNKLDRSLYNVLIVGWYGTETVGDKAILKGVYDEYLQRNVASFFYIASLNPFLTKQTIKELGIEPNCVVVNATNHELIYYSKFCNETVMGGGPLMDLDELFIPQTSFKIANKYKKVTTIHGCGIGPILRNQNLKVLKNIFELSSNISLRDQKSKDFALGLKIQKSISVINDPAKKVLDELRQKISPFSSKVNEKHIACFLRKWTPEYADINTEDFENERNSFEVGLANFIKKQAQNKKVNRIHFYAMHNFVIGHDDRDFNRSFVDKYFKYDAFETYIEKDISTIESIAHAMLKSELNICMRFHSVLFADTLQTNYQAIDYTQGGKIQSYLLENNEMHRLNTIKELTQFSTQ